MRRPDLTQAEFQSKVSDSLTNIVAANNNCSLPDRVDALGSLKDTTTYESDMTTSGGHTTCGDGTADNRDHQSVWDAGNLDKNPDTGVVPVAKACWWGLPSAGIKNDLLEADVRFNITDYDFTTFPNADCEDKYDVVSVGTHEAGHDYGLGHVSEAAYEYMTMSKNAEECDTTQRALGKGDIEGLESIY